MSILNIYSVGMYYTKYDLHCHSLYSDGQSTISDIEDQVKRMNTGVVLTDHNEIRGCIKLLEREKFITLPAIEVSTREGLEFLFYFLCPEEIENFYKELVEPYRKKRFIVQSNLPCKKLLEESKKYDCFISIAHPFGFGKKSLSFHRKKIDLQQLIRQRIDAVEIYNGTTTLKGNHKAKEFKENHTHLKHTVGSDGHYTEAIGGIFLDFSTEKENITQKLLYNLLTDGKGKVKIKKNVSALNSGRIIAKNHTRYFFTKGYSVERDVQKHNNFGK